MSSTYIAKYPFNGNTAQSQLEFPTGATIIARDGQDGKSWWWGNYLGKDGWFPPTYVSKLQQQSNSHQQKTDSISIQKRMQKATFTSSTDFRQKKRDNSAIHPNASHLAVNNISINMKTNTQGLGTSVSEENMNNSMMKLKSVETRSKSGIGNESNIFGVAISSPDRSGFRTGTDDPFAGLDEPTVSKSQSGFESFSLIGSNIVKKSNINNVNSKNNKLLHSCVMSGRNSHLSYQNKVQHDVKPVKMTSLYFSENVNIKQGLPGFSGTNVNEYSINTIIGGTTLPTQKHCQSPNYSQSSPYSPLKINQDEHSKQLIDKKVDLKNGKDEFWKREHDNNIEKITQFELEDKVLADKVLLVKKCSNKNKSTTIPIQPSLRSESISKRRSNSPSLCNTQSSSLKGTVPFLHPRNYRHFFNPYDFLASSNVEPSRKFDPIYRVQPFWFLLSLDKYIRHFSPLPESLTVSTNYDQLAKAMSFICHLVQENLRTHEKNGIDAPLSYLKSNQLGMEACIKLISILPHSAGASGKHLDSLFLNFINTFVSMIGNVQPHQQVVLPGGWQKPDGKAHICLYIVRNCGEGTFSFTVCNTGKEGLEYHPSKFDETSGMELRQLAMTIFDVASSRLLDSTFWVMLFQMQVYSSKRNNAQFLYEKLLPSLNSKPLWSNVNVGYSEYFHPPDDIAVNNFHFLARLALTTVPVLDARPSKYSSLLIMTAALDLAYQNIASAPSSSMDPEDTRILKLSGRNLANYASTVDPTTVKDKTLGSALSTTWDLLDRFLKKLNFTLSKPMDQHSHGLSTFALNDGFAKGSVVSLGAEPGSACHPFFGRFRRDYYEKVLKELLGEPRPDPILIPAVLTDETMPSVATDFQTAASSLQRLCHACSLLLHQRHLVKNAPSFVASAAQYTLTVTLPMPNLNLKLCFWRKTHMRRETQINLLFLIRRMCRIYSAATSCVQQSRGLVAIRTTAFACATCIADAISRVEATDDPSPFSLHYSGNCEGPTESFGILAGSFETLAANMPIFDPHYTSLRFRCLDYFRALSMRGDDQKRLTIFNFDQSLVPMNGDIQLINHLSIQLALPRKYPRTKSTDIVHASALISGTNGSLLEVLPELEYFRDIVFHFKHSVSGKAAIPADVSKDFTWLPHHATLKWTSIPISTEDSTPVYKVTAFRCTDQEFIEASTMNNKSSKSAFNIFLSFFGKSDVERQKLSSADPTNIVNCCGEKFFKSKSKPISVKNEDDILHLTNLELPTFGNALKLTDSERFLSFLTAPYIRIPLILDFFANGDPGRLSALRAKSLQLVVDAALFEPGHWRSTDFTGAVTEIPVIDEKKLQILLSTPLGNLYNEISKSPDVLIRSVIKMLERALDMDVGKYNPCYTSGPLILYTIRLAVRIESFLKFALMECKKSRQLRPRGLESLDIIKIERTIEEIRKMLDENAWPILEYWVEPSRCKDVDTACIVHAHLLYLFKNYTYEELSKDAISVLLSSQVFLMINHRFSSQAYDDLQDMTDLNKPPPSIQISQSEIFDIIQKQRYEILKYMRQHPKLADESLEVVVRIATGTGTRAEGTDKTTKSLKIRHWENISHSTCYGRFVPDTEDKKLRNGSYRKPISDQSFEEWMLQVTTKAVGIEVNVQISEFTLQNHKMMLLDPHVMNHADFQHTRENALNGASDVACAEVIHTSNRYWWRLVGRRYDVQSWAPDTRNYRDLKNSLNLKFSRKFPNNLRTGECWIADALQEKLPLILPGVTLYMPDSDKSKASFVQLSGWLENAKGIESSNISTLKEVVVWQNPPVINVFNVIEHGRRFFRVLEYTSNMSICLHEVTGEPYPDRIAGILSLSTGVPMRNMFPSDSLIISRALSKSVGTQVYIPKRFLAGILPTTLVDKYTFWQNENDDILGYDESAASTDNEDDLVKRNNGPSTKLKITLFKSCEIDKSGFCNSSAEALVQRIPILNSYTEREEHDINRPIMTLLNVLTASPSSFLKRLGMLLSRLDNLAHVLVWSSSTIKSVSDSSSIDVIELPRVNLSFKAKKIETIDGMIEHRLYSNDYNGLYISTSTESRETVEKLLGSIEHFIVLQNTDNDLFVLMPGCALPRRLCTDGSHLSVQVILDRRNKEWIDNMGEIRCYLYPVHNSKAFLFTPSLASSMYLMVMYFITGSYCDVFKMVESCVSEELSAEELQIFNQLEFLGNDFHPDAHACRLKLSAVTVGLGEVAMRCPWSVLEEMQEYVKKHSFASSACRLTHDEELLLLKMCCSSLHLHNNVELMNRKSFVTAMIAMTDLPSEKSLTIKLGTMSAPKIVNFDSEPDITIIENPKKTMITSRLLGAAYSRPEEDKVAYGGIKALEFVISALTSGIEVASSQYGFPLLYDLLVGTVAFKLHPSDRTHNWGRLFVRLLPHSDFQGKSSEMSALRILSENPSIACHPNIPKFQIDSAMRKFQGMFKGQDAVSRLVDQLHIFLTKSSIRAMIKYSSDLKESIISHDTVKLIHPATYSEHRLWVVPRIENYSQNVFHLDIENCANVNIPLAQLQAFASKPLAPMKLELFVQYMDRVQIRLPPVSGTIPFDISGDRATKTHCSEATFRRICDDVRIFAEKANGESIPTLIGFSPIDIESFHHSSATLNKAYAQLNSLVKSVNSSMLFDRKSLTNLMHRALAIATSDERSDIPNACGIIGECNFLRFRLGQCSEREPFVWFELLVASILSNSSERDIRSLNPYLSSTAYKTVMSLTVVAMLTSIRISQTHRALTGLTKLLLLLRRVKKLNTEKVQKHLCREISLQASKVAEDITCERHFITLNESSIQFDPRFLVFEFTYSLMLRKSQVLLVDKFMETLANNGSMCHQMIMGAGKTTVVAPLLALMVADGKSLVTQVVPQALLEFSRGAMREKFAAVVRKPVFTLHFDRGSVVNRDLFMKLIKARDSKAIICSSPTSIKSLMLKFIEMIRYLEYARTGERKKTKSIFFKLSNIARRYKEQSLTKELHVNPEDVYYCTEILKLFKTGVLLLDEVDLLLHPLKSELNWPVGEKELIDFSKTKIGIGLRWQIQWHLLDAVFYATGGKMTVEFRDSREAISILEEITAVVRGGFCTKQLQKTPHIILLERKFYNVKLKHLMARWQLLYLRNKRLPSVEDRHLLSYLINGPLEDRQASSAVSIALNDDYMKMLNLSYELINKFLPHVLSKINRVNFGLLSRNDLKLVTDNDPNTSLTRRLAAVPFVGKDVPSLASQFSHPDIVIGLTILAYRYEGLRLIDFITVLTELREKLDSEVGPFHKRPSSLRWISWIEEAGAKVRGPKEGEKSDDDISMRHIGLMDSDNSFLLTTFISGGRRSDDIWPIHLLDMKDDQHISITYKLLFNVPQVVEYYLDCFVFPLILEHHMEKISASGQDLGGDMLFGRRVGFSGTPSNLLPEELGQCKYESGVDARILHYMMTESIVTSRLLEPDWTVAKLLNDVATSDPPFHCLIDTGALITGMNNYEVAKYLMFHGLPESFDGVVFLDQKDRQMILLRHGLNIVRLNQAGVSPDRRFSFYDQIHTTGIDIHQCIVAKAALTLGKDMTFRDYAQGAFRMRGIGNGQTIELFIIPEVMQLIEEQTKHCNPHVVSPLRFQNVEGDKGSDILSLPVKSSQSKIHISGSFFGSELLIKVAAWLTVNGMKSENLQFRMLCRQSIENVIRKRAYGTLKRSYKEVIQCAFADRVREIAAITEASTSKLALDIVNDLEGMFDKSRKYHADNIEIENILKSSIKDDGEHIPNVGIEMIQRCLDVLGERIDYTVQNNIPMLRPLSEVIRNDVERKKLFLRNDYDKAVVEKVIMVLINSENLAKTRSGLLSFVDNGAELEREQIVEQEILQEQEDEEEEEEEEEEQEQEEEVIKELAKKKKYSRDGEYPDPWPLLGLAKLKKPKEKNELYFSQRVSESQLQDIRSWENSFYPITNFTVKNYMFSKALSIDFPEYMFVSNNHYKTGWSLKTHRRLKNVIVVMDFSPSKASMIEVADVGKGFTLMQERNLMKAFQIANADKSRGISIAELKEVLKAVDVDLECDDGGRFLENMHQFGDIDQDATISFDQLKQMLVERLYYRIQANRHYVVLSLAEAECMRAAIHCQLGESLIQGKDTIVALRTERTLLDASTGYEPAQSYQSSTAQACFRFFDSAVEYTSREISLLLRALQHNPCKNRENFFVEVRSNRRRKQNDPAITPLSKVFVTADEHHMLQYRIAKGRVTALLKSYGMYARDAFAAFDNDRDGMLSMSELQRGLEWLGLNMDSSLVNDIMREVDKDNDGYINLEEFKGAVGWDDDAAADDFNPVTFNAPSLPPVPLAGGSKISLRIPDQVLSSIKIKVKKVSKFQLIWTSQGSMSRQKVSVWEPLVGSGTFRANRAYVSLGHYVGSGYENPIKDDKERITLEITDTQGSFVGGSSWLLHVLDKYLPCPARFRLAWSYTHGSNPFFAWEPIPPSDKFVALGFAGTTKDVPPDVRVMRCIFKGWAKESTFVYKIWDDSGSGGREGSIWLFNTLNLVGFVRGHDPPIHHPWDLKSRRFFLKDYNNV